MADYEHFLGDIRLTASDWDLLTKSHAFLQPFASATLYAEGDKSSISQSLRIMDSLLHHYEKAKVSSPWPDLVVLIVVRHITPKRNIMIH